MAEADISGMTFNATNETTLFGKNTENYWYHNTIETTLFGKNTENYWYHNTINNIMSVLFKFSHTILFNMQFPQQVVCF